MLVYVIERLINRIISIFEENQTVLEIQYTVSISAKMFESANNQ